MRMLLMIAIGLYASRVVLQALGISDFGIYNAVGGVVGMLGIITTSLSAAIGRYLTFELGKGDSQRLSEIFSTSVNVQIIMALIVIVLAVIGLGWFLNARMNIPGGRMYAANWVLYCSILTFAVNLLSVPYNACIIAHEDMGVFAYISILEAVLKLGVIFALFYSPFDKLISYGVLVLLVSVVIRLIYGVYCKRHYAECEYHWSLDKGLLKEMTGFAGWNFLSNLAWVLNTQGINVLINMFFGVTVNAARGVAAQVETVVQLFVNNFMTALNPQITKTYATGEYEEMHTLVCRGAKFSFFLMLFFAVPICIETETLLSLWLGANVPPMAVTFVRLSFLTAMCTVLGNTLVTAQLATGKIRNYQIVMTFCGIWVFPLSWLAFKYGLGAEWAYIIYFIIYFGLIFLRIYMVKDLIHMPWMRYVSAVVVRCVVVTALSFALPVLLYLYLPIQNSAIQFLFMIFMSICSCLFCVLYVGMDKYEREYLKQMVIAKVRSRR